MLCRIVVALPALIFSVFLTSSSAQEIPVDSLLRTTDKFHSSVPDSVIRFLSEYVNHYTSPPDRAKIKGRISSAYLEKGLLDSAASNAWDVLTLAPEQEDLSALAYTNLGLVACQKLAIERASDFFHKALPLLEALHDKRNLGLVWNSMGWVSDKQNRLKEAVSYYQKSIAANMEVGDSLGIALATNNLGGAYRKLKRYPEALAYLTQSIEVCQRMGYSRQLSAAFGQLGLVYTEQKDFVRALDYHSRRLQLDRKEGSVFQGYHELAKLHLVMGKLDTASQYADSAEVIAVTGGNSLDLRACFQTRFLIAQEMRDAPKSLAYYRLFAQYGDSVLRADYDIRIENVRDEIARGTRIEAIQRIEHESQLADLRGQRDKQWQYFLFMLAGFFVLFVLSFFYWYRVKARNTRLLLEKDNRLTELNNLKDRMFTVIAHDLRSPLSTYNNLTRSLAEKVEKISPEDVAGYLRNLYASSIELSRLLNNLLEWALTQTGGMPFSPEVFNCKLIATEVVEHLRPFALEKQLQIEFLIPDTQQAYGDRAMVTIILRNLLSNAIKFTSPGRTITLFSGRKDALITLGVKDRGIGISADNLKRLFRREGPSSRFQGQRGAGIGLHLCDDLVSKNGGKFYVESIINEGSTFYFTLPEHFHS